MALMTDPYHCGHNQDSRECPFCNPPRHFNPPKKPAYEVVTTGFGKFQISPGDLIGETTRCGQLWDGAGFLQPIFREYYAPFSTVVDVGANIGTFSVWAAHEGAARVVAVEAHPTTYQMLLSSLQLNRFCDDRVIPLQVAAYSRETHLKIDIYDPTNLGATSLVECPEGSSANPPEWIMARPLDNYRHLFGPRVSLIKVDAQGCDLAALKGLAQTIAADRPTIVFEFEADLAKERRENFSDYLDFFEKARYTTFPWPTHPNNFLAKPGRSRCDD